MDKIRVGVIGATGYGGKEVFRILLKHPMAEIVRLSAGGTYAGQRMAAVFPEFQGLSDMVCENTDIQAFAGECDLVFLSTPNRVGMNYAPALLKKGTRVIDFSGDFRLKDPALHEKVYGYRHTCPELAAEAAYGMPELFEPEIAEARIVTNPGCFATSIVLGLAPLFVKNIARHSAQAVSLTGTSGAGRKPALPFILSEIEGSVKPYKVGVHQHQPEVDMALSRAARDPVRILFVPQVGPVSRGILSTLSTHLKESVSADALKILYQDFYKNAPFVRIRPAGQYPDLKDVNRTNFCDIGLFSREDQSCIAFSAIDNLIKGQSGQAVQNMNVMFGLDQTTGLL